MHDVNLKMPSFIRILLCVLVFAGLGCSHERTGSLIADEAFEPAAARNDTDVFDTFMARLENERLWGVYQIYRGFQRFRSDLDTHMKALEHTPDWVMFFRDLPTRRPFPTEAAVYLTSQGIIPVINLEFHEWRFRRDPEQVNWLERIVQGELDESFRKWARDARKIDGPILIRPGFEMNGDWFAWGQQPDAFCRAWRHLVCLFREEKADNVIWVWAPNVEWDAEREMTDMDLYYPGDTYVDVVALDGYNFGDDSNPWHSWMTFDEVYAHSIEKISKYPQPFIISEIGCSHESGKLEWMKAFFQNLKSDPRIRGFIYYNYADGKNNEPNWLLDSDPGVLELFREEVGRR